MKKSLITGVMALVLVLVMAPGAVAQRVQRGVLSFTVPFGLHSIGWQQARVGIAYENDNINTITYTGTNYTSYIYIHENGNKVRGVGVELYILPWDGFKLGTNIYGVLGNRTSQGLLGVGYSQVNGMNANIALRGDFLRVGADYSLINGLEGNFGVTSFSKLPKNNSNSSRTCPPGMVPIGGGACIPN